nr:hypothetical protein [Planctomycetota bacterium]
TAPFRYPTLEADNGPTHALIPGFGLGLLRDGEPDGIPDDNAAGDDNANLADEDGVILPGNLARGAIVNPTVVIRTGGRAQGKLQGWIDFNRDGDWDDAGEQIYRNLSLEEGTHIDDPRLNFTVPLGADPGTTYARFRYGYENDLPTTGPAPKGGEVEDYVVDILSDNPVANPDQPTVDQNSVNNVFNVMSNDIPGPNGRQNLKLLSITLTNTSGTVDIVGGDTPDLTDDRVLYTPASGAFGTDSFQYTIKDIVNLGESTTTVSVTIQQTAGTAPIAVDDSYFDETSLMVLANDRIGPTGSISISRVDDTGTTGVVSHDGQVVTYTPTSVGPDQFKYWIKDANGLEVAESATVTVHTGDQRDNDVIKFLLEITATDGTTPITQIEQGEQFQLHVYVDDARNEPGHPTSDPFGIDDQGVFSAYMDLLYQAGLVAYNGNSSLSWSADYPSGRLVDSSVPGILDELGAFQGVGSAPLGAAAKELVVATFTASALGTATFQTDPARDLLPEDGTHETSLNHPEEHVDYPRIEFGTASVQIVEPSDLVQIRLAATDDDEDESPLPNNQIVAGDTFLVHGFVKDIRNDVAAGDRGTYSTYLDVFYSAALARPVVSTSNPLGIDIEFKLVNGESGMFVAGQKAGTGTAGLIDEVGANQGQPPPGQGAQTFIEERLFTIRFEALAPGTLRFTADPADNLPLNEVTLINPYPGLSVPLDQITYIDALPITVRAAEGEGEFTNPRGATDVNDDGHTSPIDALLLINYLNSQGATDLTALASGGEGESSGTRYYYDVNADMVVSPLDVLGVISHLNSIAFQGGGEGEASGNSAQTLASETPAAEPIDMPLAFELTTLQPADPSDPSETLPERHVPVAVTDQTDSFTSQPGVSTLEEVADETDGLAQILTDDLAEDILGAWSELPSDGQLLPEMV